MVMMMALPHSGDYSCKTNQLEPPTKKTFKKMMAMEGHHCWGSLNSFDDKDIFYIENKKKTMMS